MQCDVEKRVESLVDQICEAGGYQTRSSGRDVEKRVESLVDDILVAESDGNSISWQCGAEKRVESLIDQMMLLKRWCVTGILYERHLL
ncbi:unnamed protein product [Fusarium graminearum]|nr:unnamed protein product [Fusarium graminearum]